MRYYPIGIDTNDKNILVVGGGRAAYLKIKQLVNTWACITVISKQFCKEILELQKNFSKKLILQTKFIDIKNINIETEFNLVFLCTESKELNLEIYKDFKGMKVITMMSNNRENSDFITMSTMEKEKIIVSVGSEGRSPTASKFILSEIDKLLNDEIVEKINLLCEIRELLINEKNLKSKENISSIMEKLILFNNEDLKTKIKIMKEIN